MNNNIENVPPHANTLGIYVPSEKQQDNCRKIAADARLQVERAAAATNRQSLTEYELKKRCIELELRTRSEQTGNIVQEEERAAVHSLLFLNLPRVGDHVSVKHDWRPGICSNGGEGHIKKIGMDGGIVTYSIQYVECSASGKVFESNVSLDRITVLPCLFEPKKPRVSVQRPLPMAQSSKKDVPTNSSIVELLKAGHSTNKGKGWRAKQLDFDPSKQKHDENFNKFLLRDYHQLLGILLMSNDNVHNKRTKDGKFKARTAKYNPSSMEYLAFAWGVSRRRIQYVDGKGRAPATDAPSAVNHTRESVIDSIEAARIQYSPKNEFINNFVRRKLEENKIFKTSREKSSEYRREAKVAFATLPNTELIKWEHLSRTKIQMQPHIKKFIVDDLKQNPTKTHAQLAETINQWCCASVIGRWLKKHGCETYVQRMLICAKCDMLICAIRKYEPTCSYVNLCHPIVNLCQVEYCVH